MLGSDTSLARPAYLDSLGVLRQGRLEEGFAGYESRFQDSDYCDREGLPRQGTWPLHVPRWRGEPLSGKTVLLWAEQGYGDTIQFIRYAPLVAGLGAKVLIACPPVLQRLMSTVQRVSKVYGSWNEFTGAGPQARAAYDLHAPILSLPYIFGTTLETIPATVPYLRAPESGLVLTSDDGLKIGLVWAGSPKHSDDANRSMSLNAILSLLTQAGARWHSLQVGPPSRDIRRLGLSPVVHDLNPRLTDFADTASAISQLDLVITVDTAVAHLAGALGKPVWIMLPYTADWRWLESRADSPWYPTARLFRQPLPGNWGPVIEDVKQAIGRLRSLAPQTR